MCASNHLRILVLCSLFACGGELRGEVDGQKFVRCAQAKPRERNAHGITVQERTLTFDAPSPVHIAAFTGPVGRGFTASDLAALRDDQPALALMLGGLGDDEVTAKQNVARLAALHIPVLFLAGGADRGPVIEAAFEADSEWVIDGTGLRELQLGTQRFAIAAGAVLGRYAIDEQGCGLTQEDVAAVQGPLVISWQKLAIATQTELHAFPEDLTAVPRLGLPGTQRTDGTRLRSQLGRWQVGAQGLQPRP